MSDTEVVDVAVEKALKDPTKKRKADEEIEIDLQQSVPLSKKQKRLLRRGKITLEEINKNYNIDPASIEEFNKEQESKAESGNADGEEKADSNGDDEAPKKEKKERVKFSAWIGNMAFDTTKEDLTRFIVGKTKEFPESGEQVKITEKDIFRINMPIAHSDLKKKNPKIKGFAYVDFRTAEQLQTVIAMSESQLNGRNLLIKNGNSFEGRPAKPDKDDLVSSSKNPPSRILFVGNLSFDTTDDLLRAHFQHCGEIVKIRMATFEDTGKCKGFAFIDFRDESGATKALTDKSVRKIAQRPLRMEFGEDRSKRAPKRAPRVQERHSEEAPAPARAEYTERAAPIRERTRRQPVRDTTMDSNRRVKSSIALASAQRASAAIVPSAGKKMKFD